MTELSFGASSHPHHCTHGWHNKRKALLAEQVVLPSLPIPSVPIVQGTAWCAALQPWPSSISTRAALCLLNPLPSASPWCFHSLYPITSQVPGSPRPSDRAGLAVPGLCLLSSGLRFAGAALEHGSAAGMITELLEMPLAWQQGGEGRSPLNKLCTSLSAHPPLPATNSVC